MEGWCQLNIGGLFIAAWVSGVYTEALYQSLSGLVLVACCVGVTAVVCACQVF